MGVLRDCLDDLRLRRGLVKDDGAWEIPAIGKDPNGVSLSEQYIREMADDWAKNQRRYDSVRGPSYEERGVFGVSQRGAGGTPPQWLGSTSPVHDACAEDVLRVRRAPDELIAALPEAKKALGGHGH
ncbi:MAG TPA: hypothetical protein VFO65_07440 [Acidimicrobiales bacterium]|nr:hypothetical protein [Acidimicrobiales bacterium]